MADLITIPFDSRTSEEMQEAVYDYWITQFPDYVPRPGNPEVAQTEAFTALLFELFNLAASVPNELLGYLGTLLRISPVGARAATVPSTWTTHDDYHDVPKTIPADTLVGWVIDGDTRVGFTTVNSVTIPAGQDTTAAGAIMLQAVVEGSDGNGFSGSPDLISLIDFVTDVSAVGLTANGRDAEDFTTYLNRLSRRLLLLKDRPVRDYEVAIWLTTVVEGVQRAIAFDMYNGDTNTANQERHVTWVGHDVLGAPLTTDKKAEVSAALALTREVNFNFHAKDPSYTQIDVKCVVVAEQGVDTAGLADAIKISLASSLNPLVWGSPSNPQDSSTWRNTALVRRGIVYGLITRVEGVSYIDESVVPLQIRGNSGPWVTTDIFMGGLAPLVTSDITAMDITVNPS
jgi:hypothetical protein